VELGMGVEANPGPEIPASLLPDLQPARKWTPNVSLVSRDPAGSGRGAPLNSTRIPSLLSQSHEWNKAGWPRPAHRRCWHNRGQL